MLKIVLLTIYYIIAYFINGLLILYLNKLDKKECGCIKNNNFHIVLKNSIYIGMIIPIIYLLLLGFSLITNDNLLYYSLTTVYQIIMIFVNGIITIMLFTYLQLLKKIDCKCITNGKLKSVHTTVNILSYIMLIGYCIYLIIYTYFKYFFEPKIILVNNISKLNNNIRNNNIKRDYNTKHNNAKNNNVKNNNTKNNNAKNNNKLK